MGNGSEVGCSRVKILLIKYKKRKVKIVVNHTQSQGASWYWLTVGSNAFCLRKVISQTRKSAAYLHEVMPWRNQATNCCLAGDKNYINMKGRFFLFHGFICLQLWTKEIPASEKYISDFCVGSYCVYYCDTVVSKFVWIAIIYSVIWL